MTFLKVSGFRRISLFAADFFLLRRVWQHCLQHRHCFGDDASGRTVVFKWLERFKTERQSTQGRPKASHDDEKAKVIEDVLGDRCLRRKLQQQTFLKLPRIASCLNSCKEKADCPIGTVSSERRPEDCSKSCLSTLSTVHARTIRTCLTRISEE